VAPPLVGAMGLRLSSFILLDSGGSLLWATVAVGLGYAFAAQIDHLLTTIADAGTVALELVAALLVLYILLKWWQRWRLLRALRMSRITAAELHQALADDAPVVVVDVRPHASRLLDARVVPGALLIDTTGIDHTVHDIALDRELVLYCNCPNEVSAAKLAKVLMAQGYQRVRPLLGGLDAWDAAGYPVERLFPLSADDGQGSQVQLGG
jgi:rhodanese-related sulfurtransferase